jgi:hypothetical protein
MQEAELVPLPGIQLAPIGEGSLQQTSGAKKVRAEKRFMVVDRTVYVTLGCEINYGVRSLGMKNILYGVAVADVYLPKRISLRICNRSEGLQVAGVGEYVQVHDVDALVFYQESNDGRPNETGTAGDHDFHWWLSGRWGVSTIKAVVR